MKHARFGEQNGAAAVEFALIAPVLFMLIFGIIQFGIAWSQKEVFVQAAREGARYAAVGCESSTSGCMPGQVAQRVVDSSVDYQLTDGTQTGAGIVSVQVNGASQSGCTTGDTGDLVTVGWSQNFVITIPFVPNINVNAPIQAVFRCET
jgi:Flp pilus assembly protein TadG